MNKFIVVRHGSYASDSLDDMGIKQIEKVAEMIAPLVEGQAIRILTSPFTRTQQSARILAERLQVTDVKVDGKLVGGNRRDEEALQYILTQAEGFEVVIVVTHVELSASLPTLFGAKVLEEPLAWKSLANGEARVVDCKAKTATVLS